MNKLVKNITQILVVCLVMGCQDFLDEVPKTFTEPQRLLQTAKGLEQSVNSIYNAGNALYLFRDVFILYGNTTDEMYMPTTQRGERWDFVGYNFNASNPSILIAYRAYVTAISRANMVLDNLPDPDAIEIDRKIYDLRVGEALFLRSWHYFKHMQTFGSVPLITTYNDAPLYPAKAPIADIYNQIISDLQKAEQLLPNWQDPVMNSGRASRGAARALLGLVYLTRASSDLKAPDDLKNAAENLQKVIDQEGYGLWDDYKKVFSPENKNKKEDIFSQQAQASTPFPSIMYTEFVPSPAPSGATRGYGYFGLTRLLFNSFEPGDKRLGLIINGSYVVRTTNAVANTNHVYHEKYLDPVNGALSYNNFSTNLPLIRYADVLLLHAEALNELNSGPDAKAYQSINLVRRRAGLADLDGLSKTQFFDAVMNERYHELYHENIRWFDLKRWGLLKQRVESREVVEPFLPKITVDLTKHTVFPFPQQEIDANTNLKQNPGY